MDMYEMIRILLYFRSEA